MSAISALKASIRRKFSSDFIKADAVLERSRQITANVLRSEAFERSDVIFIYLSMPACEVQTYDIVRSALQSGKTVFAPRIIGKSAADMELIQVLPEDMPSATDSTAPCSDKPHEVFPKYDISKWGIPEPPIPAADDRRHTWRVHPKPIDLVLVPGARLGHGKGYYDNFFARAAEAYKTKLPTRLALCFDEQLLDDAEIPMEPHDVFMEEIITPTRHIIAGAVPTIKYTNVEAS